MRQATDVFSEWADIGKDAGMEKGHAPAVSEILAAAFEEMGHRESGFDAIDEVPTCLNIHSRSLVIHSAK